MSSSTRRTLLLALWICCLACWPASLHPQAQQPGKPQAAKESSQQGENEHEMIFKIINFAILAVALGYLLRRGSKALDLPPMAEFLANRSQGIRKGLEEGRRALEAAQAQLQNVEAKLGHLEQEVAALKATAISEMQAERERLRKAAEEEARKTEEFARAQVEAAVRAARLEIKKFTARQALVLAKNSIPSRLDEAGRRRLFAQFLADLGTKN